MSSRHAFCSGTKGKPMIYDELMMTPLSHFKVQVHARSTAAVAIHGATQV